MKGPLFKTGEIVRLNENGHGWAEDLPSTAIVIKTFSNKTISRRATGFVCTLLIGDVFDDFHECYLENAKDDNDLV